MADIFSEEKTNGTEKIRLVQPVKRLNILFAKVVAAFLFISILLLGISLVSYLLAGSLGRGFGPACYPLEIWDGYISSWGPVGGYVLLAISYFGLHLFLVVAVLAFITVLMKETVLVSSVGFALVFVGNNWGKSASPFNIFSFQHFGAMILAQEQKPSLMLVGGVASALVLVFLTYYLGRLTWVQNLTLTPKDQPPTKALKKCTEKNNRPLPCYRFELLKLARRRTVLIPFILLLLLIAQHGLQEFYQYESVRQELFNSNNEWRNYLEIRVEENNKLLAENDLPPEMVEGKLKTNAIHEKGIRLLSGIVKAIENNDADGAIDYQKRLYQYEMDNVLYDHYIYDTTEVFLATLDELRNRQVKPVYALAQGYTQGTISSPFAWAGDLRRNDIYNIRNYQPSVTFIFNSFFKVGLGILVLGIFAISLARGFSDETHDSRSIYLLNSQPLSPRRIFFGKLLAQGTGLLAMVAILVLVLFSTLKLAGSPWETNFPAVRYLNSIDGYTGVKLWRSNLTQSLKSVSPASTSSPFVGFTFRDMIGENTEMVALLVLGGLVIVAFALLASQKVRHKTGVSIGTAVFFGLGYLVSYYALKRVGLFFPFIWFNSPAVATGEASMVFDTTPMVSWVGCLVLSLWLIGLVVVGYRLFVKTGRYQ